MIITGKLCFVVMLVCLCCQVAIAQCKSEQHTYVPKDGYVPNAEVAVSIAEAVLVPIYGKDVISSEKPFTATLCNDVWVVEGRLPKGYNIGGVARVEIVKSDGRILRVTHGK